MTDMFNCCVQCLEFWTCVKRAENLQKDRPASCCDSCGNFELCRIVAEKLKDDPQSPTAL